MTAFLTHFLEQVRQIPAPGIQRRFLAAIWARRAFTIFLSSEGGKCLSIGNWMVPLEMGKAFRSSLNCSMILAVGKMLQLLAKAANQMTISPCLNAGIL